MSPEAFPDRTFAAEVARIAPSVDPSSGTIEVELSLEDPSELRPDMTVSVEIEVGRVADAWVLPVALIRDLGSDRPWVMVVEEGVAQRRDVVLGLEGDDRVEVREGVDEDTQVIPASVPLEIDDPVRVRRTEPAR